MASIRKQKNSYLFRVSCGYDTNGKQIIHSMTWKPDKSLTVKQADREAVRQAELFEEQCKISMILKDQMSLELIKRFQRISFDDKIYVINYVNSHLFDIEEEQEQAVEQIENDTEVSCT